MNNAMAVNWMALLFAAGPVLAQQQAAPPPAVPAASSVKPAAQATAQSEAGDPRADTSNAPATAPSAAPSATPAPSGVPAPSAPPSAARAPSTGRAQAAPASDGRSGAPGGGSGQKSAPNKIDRLELGTATVTGDREQPKVMYIVPWKRSDIGDLAGKPMNSLVDEILAPVDRDVFKREVVYYNAVQADASQNGAPPKRGQQGEK
jgi:hypothetical protein